MWYVVLISSGLEYTVQSLFFLESETISGLFPAFKEVVVGGSGDELRGWPLLGVSRNGIG